MQTFLPYSDFSKSADALDKRRCWKQVVEARQILDCLTSGSIEWKNHPAVRMWCRWKNHPAVRMWCGYEEALAMYFDVFLQYAKEKHHINTQYQYILQGVYTRKEFDEIIYPWWLGDKNFHRAMRARLIEKMPLFYEPLWPDDKGFNDGKYFWPVMETRTFKII